MVDLTGHVFGRLTAIKPIEQDKNHRYIWLCKCICGKHKKVFSAQLVSKNVKSCGCLYKENGGHNYTHGKCRSFTYSSWHMMKIRCYLKRYDGYKNYGGRGIKVCKRWHKFENFYKDMGDRLKGYTLERINNNGDYKPSNCKWIIRRKQLSNKRNNVYFYYMREKMTMKDFAEKYNICYGTLRYYRKHNKTSKEIIKILKNRKCI